MRIYTLMIIAVLFFAGCKSPEKKDKKSVETTTEENNVKVDEIQIISDLPEIDGCSCYYSQNKDEFKNEKYIFLNNYSDLAFMKINGKIERFKKINSKQLESPDHTIEIWKNNNYELSIETKKVNKEGKTTDLESEIWKDEGKLILKSKEGNITEKKLFGECGC